MNPATTAKPGVEGGRRSHLPVLERNAKREVDDAHETVDAHDGKVGTNGAAEVHTTAAAFRRMSPVAGGIALILLLVAVSVGYIFVDWSALSSRVGADSAGVSTDWKAQSLSYLARSKLLLGQLREAESDLNRKRVEVEREIARTQEARRRQELQGELSVYLRAIELTSAAGFGELQRINLQGELAMAEGAMADKNFEGAYTRSRSIFDRLDAGFRSLAAAESLARAELELSELRERLDVTRPVESPAFQQARALVATGERLIAEGALDTALEQGFKPALDVYRSAEALYKEAAGNRARAEIAALVSEIEAAMVRLPAGEFQMGIVRAGALDARPVHKVHVRTFKVSKYVVKNSLMRRLAASSGVLDPARFASDDLPATSISWNEVSRVVKWLASASGRPYRLLSEAEWEYAARHGLSTTFPWGSAPGSGNANCADCGTQWSGRGPSPVGSFRANQFGLYDMNGNVWQWVQDCYLPNYDRHPASGQSVETPGCERRVARGGAWNTRGTQLHPALRSAAAASASSNNLGFRLASD